MPLRNRVTPFGDLLADPGRGLVYGNRGCLHDACGRIRRRYAVRRWISCQLEFRGWKRERLVQPGKFTELFFLDEATAFAAGHRPCALCRREDYKRFTTFWRDLHPGQVGADAIDAQLHAERVDPATRGQLHHVMPYETLPDGTFVVEHGVAFLVLGTALLRWSASGYTERLRRPSQQLATVITPSSLVAVLDHGWHGLVPVFHPSSKLG